MHEQISEAFPFLQSIPRASRDAFLAQAVGKSLENKQVLVRDGNECAYLPFVLEGTLRVFKTSETGKELTLNRIERGESCILTATCILNGSSFPAIAEAEGSTDVLLAPARLLVRFVEEVAFHHIDSRIAAYLLKFVEGREGVVSRTHAEIASELGTSREVVTRILRDFEAAGCVTKVTDEQILLLYIDHMMKQNMGIADRVIRIALAAVVAVLYFTNQLPMIAAIILGILAVVFLVTGIVGICPVYLLFGISTKRNAAV